MLFVDDSDVETISVTSRVRRQVEGVRVVNTNGVYVALPADAKNFDTVTVRINLPIAGLNAVNGPITIRKTGQDRRSYS